MAESPVDQCVCGCEQFVLGGRGNRSEEAETRHGNCFPIAYAYLKDLPDDGVRLVHGEVLGSADGSYIGRAWILEAGGWVWEPTSNVWFHDEEAFAESMLKPKPDLHFSPSEARAGREEGELGYWTPPVEGDGEGSPAEPPT